MRNKFKLFRNRFGQVITVPISAFLALTVAPISARAAENEIADTSNPDVIEQVAEEQAPVTYESAPVQEQAPATYESAPVQEQAPVTYESAPVQEQAPATYESAPVQEETSEVVLSPVVEEAPTTEENQTIEEVSETTQSTEENQANQENTTVDTTQSTEENQTNQENTTVDTTQSTEENQTNQENTTVDTTQSTEENQTIEETSQTAQSEEESHTAEETTVTTQVTKHYTTFIKDGKINIIGEVSEEDLAKLNDALIQEYGEDVPEVQIWSGLEEGNNQLGSTGVIVNIDKTGKVNFSGTEVSNVKELSEDFKVIKTTVELADNQYIVTKDENNNYELVLGGVGLGADKLETLIARIKADHPELANVNLIPTIAPTKGGVDIRGKEIVVNSTDQSLQDAKDRSEDSNATGVVDKPFEEPTPDTPKPDTPKPDTPKPENPKPENPKPENPKPENPKPETPKSETPTPKVTPTPVPSTTIQSLPKTGDSTKTRTVVNLFAAGVAALAAGIALDRRNRYNFGFVGPEFQKILVNSSKSTFNNQFRKIK